MKYISFTLLITLVLVAMAQVSVPELQNITDGVWLYKSNKEDGIVLNTILVEEDSTLTMVDLPADEESAKKLISIINEEFGKDVGQLIISSYSQNDTSLIEIFNPEVIHDFETVVQMMGAGNLVENNADLSVAIGNFTVFDATPRLSMLFPGDTFLNDNLIVFNKKDKFVYLGTFKANNKKLSDTQKESIQKSIEFIETNTENCKIFLARTGTLMDDEYLSSIKASLK